MQKSWDFPHLHWKQKVINQITLSSLVVPSVVVMPSYGATLYDKVVKLVIFGFQCWARVLSSIGRDTIIFYACTMEVWHISSYFVIRTRLKDDIWPHLTLFRLFCDPDRGQDDIWPHLTQFNTSRDRGQVENCAIEPCLTSLTHLKRHEW